MSDENSDPLASATHSQSPADSVPPPSEPNTPTWLTLLGLGLFLVVLAWFAVQASSKDASSTPEPAASASATADVPPAPSEKPVAE